MRASSCPSLLGRANPAPPHPSAPRPCCRAQVAHLVRIETDAMFFNRKVAEAEAFSLKPPLRVAHPAAVAAAAAAAGAAAARQQAVEAAGAGRSLAAGEQQRVAHSSSGAGSSSAAGAVPSGSSPVVASPSGSPAGS